MRLFEWDEEPIAQLPADPTPERLLEFLCTPGLAHDLASFKKRYREVSRKDQHLFFTVHEPEMVENLFWPLRHAKTGYLVGNFVGTIALCGLVAEKVAILIHALNTPDEQQRDEFERKGQAQRIDELKDRGLIQSDSVQDFGHIRAARRNCLHYWNSPNPNIRGDAVQAYAAAVRPVLSAMGFTFAEGRLQVPPQLAAYLRDRGALRPAEGNT